MLRLKTYSSSLNQTSTNYDVADISVNSTTGDWSLVYSPQAATTTTLEAPTPASPQTSGASVTLTADVTDASAPGTVQFESGGDPVGSVQPSVTAWRTLATTALPVGTDSLTAVFTPTTGAAFADRPAAPFRTPSTRRAPPRPRLLHDSGQPGDLRHVGHIERLGHLGCVGHHHRHRAIPEAAPPIGSPQTVSAGAASSTTTALPVGLPTRSLRSLRPRRQRLRRLDQQPR